MEDTLKLTKKNMTLAIVNTLDLKIRLICGRCGKIERLPIIMTLGLNMPTCCGVDLLIAGASKIDKHGLTGQKGSLVDPVNNIVVR